MRLRRTNHSASSCYYAEWSRRATLILQRSTLHLGWPDRSNEFKRDKPKTKNVCPYSKGGWPGTLLALATKIPRGAVPASYIQNHNLQYCTQCHALLSMRTRGSCYTCRDAAQARASAKAMRNHLRQSMPTTIPRPHQCNPAPTLQDVHT